MHCITASIFIGETMRAMATKTQDGIRAARATVLTVGGGRQIIADAGERPKITSNSEVSAYYYLINRKKAERSKRQSFGVLSGNQLPRKTPSGFLTTKIARPYFAAKEAVISVSPWILSALRRAARYSQKFRRRGARNPFARRMLPAHLRWNQTH